jgi:hypothetical protein
MRNTLAGAEDTTEYRAVVVHCHKSDAEVTFLSTLHALRAFPRKLIFRKFIRFGAGPAHVDWQASKQLPSAVEICMPGGGASALSRIEARHAARFEAFENSKRAILLECRHA